MRKSRLVYRVAGLTVLAMFGFSQAVAQVEPPQDIADTWIMVVKPGHSDEFENAFKDHLKMRAKKKDSREWRTFVPVAGDDLNHYVIRHCCVSYAQMDEYTAWSQKAKINDHWNENVDPHVASYRHHYSRVDFANSNWPEIDPGFQLFGTTRWSLEGSNAAARTVRTQMSKVAKDGGWSRNWSWSTNITGASELLLVTPYMNFADMQGPEGGFGAFLTKQIGEEKAAEMFASFGASMKDANYTVYRYMPDMSMTK